MRAENLEGNRRAKETAHKRYDFWHILPLLLFVITLLITFLGWYGVREDTNFRNQAYFKSLVADTQDILLDRYSLYEQALFGGLGLFYASQTVEREEWRNYVAALDVEEKLPGINGLGFIDYVLSQDLDAYLRDTQDNDVLGFSNRPDTFYPDKFIIKYIEPVSKNIEAVGLDIGFEANRRAAAERARDLGVPALTKKILLVQDKKKEAGFLLLVPVYKTHNTPPTIEQRREHFEGWVYAPFIGSNFLQGLGAINKSQLDFQVYDGQKITPEAIIYESNREEQWTYEEQENHAITHLEIAGRIWTISWKANQNYTPPASHEREYFVFIVGLILSILIFLILSRLLRSKELIQRKVDEKTRELKESSDFQKLVQNSIPAAIFVKDEHFRIVNANRYFLNFYPEDKRESVIGYTTLEDYDEKEAQEFLKDDKMAFEKGYVETEETITLPSGERRTFFTKKARFENKVGEKFILGIAQDVTEKMREENVLNKIYAIASNPNYGFEKKMRETLEVGKEYFDLELGIISEIIDDDYFVRFVSENEDLEGGEVFEYKNTYCAHTFGSKVVKAWHNAGESEIADHPCYENFGLNSYIGTTILVNDTPFGTLNFTAQRAKENPFTDREKSFINLIAQYIGSEIARYQNSQEILSSNAELARSNHELERFAYIASHDLQEPLRKIGGFTERLASHMDGQLDDKAQKYMEFVTSGVERMRELVMGLLEYSRVTTTEVEVEKLDANEIVASAMDNLSERIEENEAAITVENLPSVYYDKIMLIQLFQNLIGNALKYRSEQTPEIRISATKSDKKWVFAVEDNGMGMEEKFLERIFEMFQRLHRKEDISGTGIGLSLCQKIVERYGGEIWAESGPGKGSTFYFTIPDQKA